MKSSAGPQLTLAAGESRSALQTIGSLLPYLWPRDDMVARFRVVVAAIFLVCAKLALVWVPVVYSWAVDALVPTAGGAAAIVAVPMALIVGYGLLRVAASGLHRLCGVMHRLGFVAQHQAGPRLGKQQG